MPRLTPEEYRRACGLGFDPDTLTLDQLGSVRSYHPPPKIIKELAGNLDIFLNEPDEQSNPLGVRSMGYQQELFDSTPEPPMRPTVAPEYPSGSSPRERFELFTTRNPHIKNKLRRMALELKHKGHDHYGIKALIEVLRWDYAIRTQSSGDFKINNSFATPYAYLLMDENPELMGFFKTRQR